MAVRLSHRKKSDLQSYTILALGAAYTVTGQAATLRAGRRLVVPDRIPYSYTGYAASLTTGTGDVWNIVPAPSWTEGVSAPYDLTDDLPSTYADGGVYTFGYEGTTPPTGLTLTEAGSLDVGTATAATTTDVKFAYYEPGATTTLTIHSQVAGTYPYMATIYPLEGTVPSGQILVSTDDTTFRSTVLSTWPDGSAQVMVGAGHKLVSGGATTDVKLRPGLSSGTALTTAYIDTLLTSVSVNFGAGVQTFTNFTSGYDRIWWANSQVICARYRLSCGLGVLEAVIDVHAFANGRAFVEVVIENGKTNCGAATVTAPSPQAYTNATVSVNGTTIATVSSPTTSQAFNSSTGSRKTGTWAGGHAPFRAWYCSGWVGGDPLIEVTHDTASLRAHPWFYEPIEATSETMATKYAQTYDTYTPFQMCRLRLPGMSGGSDDQQIALFTEEQSDYILNGDKYSRRAVIATGLACHSANFNWRHTDGNLPTRTQMSGKTTSGGSGNGLWPENQVAPAWGGDSGGTVDGSHVPSVGIVPFLCRPSPCFIEIAQKEFCWHATNYNSPDAATHSFDQARARGWRLRNYAGAIFLTPDADYDGTGRKASLRAALTATIAVNNAFFNLPWNTLQVIWGVQASVDSGYSNPGDDMAPWQAHFCILCWTAIDNVKVLRGSDQTAWTTMTDKLASYPVRYINQATAGEWRAMLYVQYLGQRSGSTTDMGVGDFGERNRTIYGGSVPAATGSWLGDFTEGPVANWAAMTPVTYVPQWSTATNYNYDAIFWSAFCASVERGQSGADTAWDKVVTNGGLTNLSTWRQGFRNYPRFNRWPRNK